MNRIYQGKVTSVEVSDGKNNWKPFDSDSQKSRKLWQEALWEHHRLFQDAVNYYIVCLAAMANDDESPMGKLRLQLKGAWEPFDRSGRSFKGLRDSIAPYLAPNEKKLTLDDACTAVLRGNSSSKELLQLAVDALVEGLGGDAAIQQGGRSNWPRFCNPSFGGNYDRSATSLAREAARKWMPGFVHDSKTTLKAAEEKLELHLFANPAQDKPCIKGSEAKTRFREAVHFFEEKLGKYKSDFERLISTIDRLPETIEFPRYVGSSVKGADKDRFNAFLLFKYVEQSGFTFNLLRNAVPEPKPTGKTKKEKDEVEDRFLRFGDDPIKLARGNRGYIFRAFTSFPCWGAKGPQDIRWSEFDIAAFKEALKTANQFQQKTKERLDEADKLAAELACMEGDRSKFKPSEGEEREAPPVIVSDPRFVLLKHLLEEELADDQYLTEGESVSYGLQPRTLRGFRELSAKWNKAIDPEEPFSEEKKKRLIEITDKFQEANKDSIGSVNLFKAILDKNYWSLWQRPTEEVAIQRQKAGFSFDILKDYQRYLELKADIKRLREEPIRFTPADTYHSRRLFMFSDLTGRSKSVHLPNSQSGRFAVDVSISLCGEDGVWNEARLRLYYTSPRLRRDGLRKDNGENLERSVWIQPMVAALHLPEPEVQDFSTCAVSLMPERTAAGESRILLNFPVTLDPDWLTDALGKKGAWEKQFVAYGKGSNEQKFFLRWPKEITDSQKKARPWWTKMNGFSCLAVDLGQRDAGALALLEARANYDFGRKPSRFIGKTEDKKWHAALAASGLLRLPGEDARVYRDGKWQQELSGEKGRLATSQECAEAEIILRSLEQDPAAWLGTEPHRVSFPEQNTKLLRAMRRAQGFLAQCHRWLWMLKDQDKMGRVLSEIGEQERRSEWQGFAKTKNTVQLQRVVIAEIQKLNKVLSDNLVLMANRCLPLRGRKWVWSRHPDSKSAKKGCHVLRMEASPSHKPLIAGQRGLSLERIEQIEELRQRFQSLNRVLQREPGTPPRTARELRNDPIPDCCPDLLEKLERLKEQRVNQTAHMIVAQALGVRLREHAIPGWERKERDVHGEYERIADKNSSDEFRAPVDFVVLEDLSRYLGSQGRSPRENSRLMKWCHRQILAKVKELCEEPLGIPVLETPAAYSSKFCSRTGVAGFRAIDLTPQDRYLFPWKLKLEEEAKSDDGNKPVTEFFDWLDRANAGRNGGVPRCLMAPLTLGPLFVPLKRKGADFERLPLMQADINAAVNLGLRAMAAPDVADVHLRIRSEMKAAEFSVLTQSKREKTRWGSKPPQIVVVKESERLALAREGGHPNFFADMGRVALFDHARIDGVTIPVASGRGVWGAVRRAEWRRCRQINAARLRKWGLEPSMEWKNHEAVAEMPLGDNTAF